MKDEEWEEAHRVGGVDRLDGSVGSDGLDEMDEGRGWDEHGLTRTGTDGAEGRED